MTINYDHVCVDVETTGLDPRLDEVVEVTAMEYNLSGAIGKTFTRLCRPQSGMISKRVTDIHGITYEMVKDSPCYLKDKIREELFSFIGKRTVTGHNVEKFDLGFLKIKPVKIIDTLILSKKMFTGSHNLGSMCKKLNIEFDKEHAHGSEYDVIKTIALHIKLNNILMKESEKEANLPIFTEIKEAVTTKRVGVVPTEDDIELFYTQIYSFSRINTFHTCPFKWYMLYIKKIKEPPRDYLTVGSVCHKIAEEAGKWCYKRTIINKIISYKGREMTFDPTVIFTDSSQIPVLFPGIPGLYELIFFLDKHATNYERVTMPDREDYDKIVNTALAQYSVNDPSIVCEIKYIMNKYYLKRDLSTSINGMLITEKRLVFDKDWKVLQDFYANNAFFRGIIDVIKYDNKTVVITDYKSSRVMMSYEELQHDMQLKMYVMMVYHFLPRESYNKIIIKIDYIRFCQEILYEIENIDEYISEAHQWVVDSIKLIENNIISKDGMAFQPTRNQYCGSCFLAEDGICPLFNQKFINDIGDPCNFMIRSPENCVAAFKKAEVLSIQYANLMKKCKEFIKSTDIPVVIDEIARLGLYTKAGLEISPEKFTLLMLDKGFKLKDFINAFGLTKTSLDKIQKQLKTVLTNEELMSIGEESHRVEFKALTPIEIEKYCNC